MSARCWWTRRRRRPHLESISKAEKSSVNARLGFVVVILLALACGRATPIAMEPTLTPPTGEIASPQPTITAQPTSTAIAAGTPFPGPWAADHVVEITGSEAFVQQTEAALALLESNAPDAYEKILTFVGVIGQGEHSGMWAFETPPRYEVGQATAFSTLTWYASTIAHDATHSELYYVYRQSHPGQPIPQEAWADVASERFCIAYQLDVAERIGAPASETEYLAGLTGDHCDVDLDGDCDWDDYYARDW